MRRYSPIQSVVTKLVACVIVGGLLVTLGISVMEIRRSAIALQLDTTGRVTLATRNIQSILRGLLDEPDHDDLENTLIAFAGDDVIDAIGLTGPGIESLAVGQWEAGDHAGFSLWQLDEQASSHGNEIVMDQMTCLHAPFTHKGSTYVLEMLVNGPAIKSTLLNRVYERLGAQWLLLMGMVLLGLLLLRRWFTGPLSEISERVRDHAGPEPFKQLARDHRGEFGQLAGAIAAMIEHVDQANADVAERERAFESLYQLAPSAMLSLDLEGRIINANRRAGSLLGVDDEQQLVGQAALTWIREQDRPMLAQALERLNYQDAQRLELRVLSQGQSIDVAVEAVALRDANQAISSIRLSFLDVSQAKELQQQLENQTGLLNLVINHMSDAILLVDAEHHVAAFNQQLAAVLRCRPEGLLGQTFDHETFWDAMGIVERDQFIHRLKQIEADDQRAAQERFVTRSGTFCFQGIPVHDANETYQGRLWVIQETTPQEQSQRLLNEQNQQLAALKQVGLALSGIVCVDELIRRSAELVRDLLKVEAVGLAIRTRHSGRRDQQILHRGSGPMLYEVHHALGQAVTQQLMPEVFKDKRFAFWDDLPRHLPWSQAFGHAGLTCLAAGALRGDNDDGHGVIWIAQRGGQRLERHQLFMLETLAPLISARLEIAQLNERLDSLQLTDAATGLPNRHQLDHAMHQISLRPGAQWSLLVIDIDHFRKINETFDHDRADAVLQQWAQCLLANTRRSGTVARDQGSTFAILAPDLVGEEVLHFAQRLRKALAKLPAVETFGSPLTASIGIVSCPADTTDPDIAHALAWDRVRFAKQSGRDQICSAQVDLPRQAG